MFWYHALTKHSYNSVRSDPNRLDWGTQPSPYKRYPCVFDRFVFDLSDPIDRFLYHIGGINAKKTYPSAVIYLRMNPSAGALYPNELYVQIRAIKGKVDGIYHYDVSASALCLLYPLQEGEGIEPYLGIEGEVEGFVFLISQISWRSSWKYRNRAFRYCLLDGGHLLGAIEASALMIDKSPFVMYGWEKKILAKIFGFEDKEAFISASVVGKIAQKNVTGCAFALGFVNATGSYRPNEIIAQAYRESSDFQACKPQTQGAKFSYEMHRLENAIFTRRSQRGFGGEAIEAKVFDALLKALEAPIASDCDVSIDVYAVVNRVLYRPQGVILCGKYLRYGDFSKEAGYLSLEQYHLSTQGAVVFFMVGKKGNYQAMYQKAGILGHRIYICATYYGIGASGIGAYYDDEVCEFLGLDPNESMVLYAFAVGK